MLREIKDAIMSYLESNAYYPENLHPKLNWFIRMGKWIIVNYLQVDRRGRRVYEIYAYFKLTRSGEMILKGEYWIEKRSGRTKWLGDPLYDRKIRHDCVKVKDKFLC
ncbi:hypothetical protein AAGT10_05600 [Sulfolobus tengchongensis]|uniref:hypothetical protein n=1 Tax=Sulfolobaceae TaxID=118883 RepID=UPI001F05845B|nr:MULTISPECIES: hypothetical protein [Sulfolobaceae]MCH1772287.1 hypothetical protein [Metallosphaera sedula]MCH4816857.1 hypothetical protein [Saccharolobus shibatae]